MQFWLIKEDGLFLWEGELRRGHARAMEQMDPDAWRGFISHVERLYLACRERG